MDLGIPVKNRTLLLGAGFSHNFGGFLANEINDLLLVDPNITAHERIRRLVKDDYNYEHALAVARKEGYTEAEVKAFEEAIITVYKKQNAILVDYFNQHYAKFDTTYTVKAFFNMFVQGNWEGSGHNSAYLFSLNQDNLLEALLTSDNTFSVRPFRLPGIQHKSWFFNTQPPIYDAEQRDSKIQIQDDSALVEGIQWRNHVNVVKLHGSAEWQNQNGDLLVIGGDKELFIEQSPLLSAYQEAFKSVLTQPGMRLMVIGYGFADAHINDIILDGINAGMKLWVWGYANRKDWESAMMHPDVKNGEAIREAAAYSNPPLVTVLSGNGLYKREFHPFVDAFFAD